MKDQSWYHILRHNSPENAHDKTNNLKYKESHYESKSITHLRIL